MEHGSINHATSNHRSRSAELARGFCCTRGCGDSIKTRAADKTKKCLIEGMIARIFCQLQRRNIARRPCGDYERMIEGGRCGWGWFFLIETRYNAQCCSGGRWTRVLARIRGNKRRHCVFERLTRCQREPARAYAKQRRC